MQWYMKACISAEALCAHGTLVAKSVAQTETQTEQSITRMIADSNWGVPA